MLMLFTKRRGAKEVMKVLVTGGAGFLGERLTALLRESRELGDVDEIRVFDAKAPKEERSRHFAGDILDEERLRHALEGVDIVFHLAALVDWGREKASRLHAINVEGTRRVIECARAAGARAFVYVSSIDVVFTGRPILDGSRHDLRGGLLASGGLEGGGQGLFCHRLSPSELLRFLRTGSRCGGASYATA